jgi:hypothetical protein
VLVLIVVNSDPVSQSQMRRVESPPPVTTRVVSPFWTLNSLQLIINNFKNNDKNYDKNYKIITNINKYLITIAINTPNGAVMSFKSAQTFAIYRIPDIRRIVF